MPLNILFLTLLDFQSLEESNIYTDLMSEFVKIITMCPLYLQQKEKRIKTHLIEINDKCEILKLRIGNIQKTNLIEKVFYYTNREKIYIRH
ncbi:hypothetical protein [Enterococcus faecium]|uniref:hypothetical protein n=1 Tax=Enterococcus faecium TaxID=1352 RepID=UPI0024B8BAA1|nr:hypothetical protein [Enterococcus faecium]